MLAKILSSSVQGIDAFLVDVEVDIALGLPCLEIVGLPDKAVKEAKERVRAALKNSGFEFPSRRITVNLAPGDLKKEGTGFDLPIALGILLATGQINFAFLDNYVMVGELSLAGQVRPVCGLLAIAEKARLEKKKGLLVARENEEEASLIGQLEVISLDNLAQLKEKNFFNIKRKKKISRSEEFSSFDMQEIKGQEQAKRVLEIAAAGNHNLLMLGPPGSGKTMLAQRMPSILPDLTEEEALEVTKIYSITGLIAQKGALIRQRPYRSPHHTISSSGLLGGGKSVQPGEITLAHHGVLFLDELTEFRRDVLEALRQPLEEKSVKIMRNNISYHFPANILLLACCNPCPCGFRNDKNAQCLCTDQQVKKYLAKISGPLWDRFDIQLEISRLSKAELLQATESECSQQIKKRVEMAKSRQKERLQKLGLDYTLPLKPLEIKKICFLSPKSQVFLSRILDSFTFTARAYNKILLLARTIADLAAEDEITPYHLSEAVQYRTLDKNKFF